MYQHHQRTQTKRITKNEKHNTNKQTQYIHERLRETNLNSNTTESSNKLIKVHSSRYSVADTALLLLVILTFQDNIYISMSATQN